MNNVVSYYSAMHHAKKMYKQGIITFEDLRRINKVMAEKYCIKRSSIYLIDFSFRGNIVPTKEEE